MHPTISYNRRDSDLDIWGHSVGFMKSEVSFVRSATVSELCALEHHLAGKCKIQRILEFKVEGLP